MNANQPTEAQVMWDRRRSSHPKILVDDVLGLAPRKEDGEKIKYVRDLGLPKGIGDQLIASTRDFAMRYWIIDNSGSMKAQSGHRVVRGAGGREGMVACSRWEELGEGIKWHAAMAAHLHAPTEFRLLNAPSGFAGKTAIRQVTAEIRSREASLRGAGKRAVVVIASDGAASDGDVHAALRPLKSLPAWVVVRLCTDDDAVVQYWNGVDKGMDMDVLDDLAGEAAEVTEANPFLTYAAPMHRLREWGTSRSSSSATLPTTCAAELDYEAFARALDDVQKSVGLVWDPLRNRNRPYFDLKKLHKSYSDESSCFVM
ncbi:hypothetical protein JL722_9589 [Aureococcus anophagefferens]|nr:hypothetical protein JL722_9589 [Aureococcus anophagefferens]